MTTYSLRLTLLAVFTYALLSSALLALPISAEAQTKKLQFRNFNEMVGWVKAKGVCEATKAKGGQDCQIRIDLPNDEVREPKGTGIWQVWAVIKVLDLPEYRSFSATIIKSRNIVLLPSDPRSTIRSVKSSRYSFEGSGKVSQAAIGITLELPSGEYLLDQEILLEPERVFLHGEGVKDSIILQCQLGIAWEYRRDKVIGFQC